MPQQLLHFFRRHSAAVVAFSGGLDSSVVAKAAALVLGKNAHAVMAVSATNSEKEVDDAKTVAQHIGIPFTPLKTSEMNDAAFLSNQPDRCYHCKRIRFGHLRHFADEHDIALLVDGSNAEDKQDYRPGKRAGQEWAVRSPLAELGLNKAAVRKLARFWNLPNSEKPAAPCLATRLAYGLKITEERLRCVEQAEQFLMSLGFSTVRVRTHPDHLARIEVAEGDMERLWLPENRTRILSALRALGFCHVSVNLASFRSGSMNDAILQ